MTTYTVMTTSDAGDPLDGSLSLREALALADSDPTTADTIVFDGSVQGQTIVLAGSQLTANSDVTIDGGGVTIDADERSRVLLVEGTTPDDANEITLAHLGITGGLTTGEDDAGGGIRVGFYAALTLDHVIVSDNTTSGDYGEGGGIAAAGSYSSVTLLDSRVVGNSTTGYHARGGGIYGYSVALTNSTVSGNVTAGDDAGGGGIYGYYVALTNSATSDNRTTGTYAGGGGIAGMDFSSLSLTNSTVSGNRTLGLQAAGGGIAGYFVALTNSTVNDNGTAGGAAKGGGISVADYGAATIANSIVAGNSAAGSTDPDLAGSIVGSNGHNIFGSDVLGNASGDVENVPASLLFAGVLADNGGSTETVALRDAADNPALGGADPAAAPATDQRGVARPQPTGTNPDIGAFELGQSATGPPASEIDGTRGDDILRGTAGAELIHGRAGGDRLWGLAGDDDLFGGYGSDVLIGGPGLDRMAGGAGADRFVLRQPEAAPPDGPAYDEIRDFSRTQHDQIDLQPIDAEAGAAGNQAFSFIGRHEFTRADQLRYEATADGDFLVSGNVDRDLDADFTFILRTDHAGLKAGDFLL